MTVFYFVRTKWALDHWQHSAEGSNVLGSSPSHPFKTGLKTLLEQLMGMLWLLLSRPLCHGTNFHVSMFSGNISDVGIIHLDDRLLSFSLTSCILLCILLHQHKGRNKSRSYMLYLYNLMYTQLHVCMCICLHAGKTQWCSVWTWIMLIKSYPGSSAYCVS